MGLEEKDGAVDAEDGEEEVDNVKKEEEEVEEDM